MVTLISDDDLSHPVSEVGHRTNGHPHVHHPLVSSQGLGIIHTSLGVDQDQAAHPSRSTQCSAQGQEPSLAHATEDRPINSQGIHQRNHVGSGIPVTERLAVMHRGSKASFVPCDDAATIGKSCNLSIKHLMVH